MKRGAPLAGWRPAAVAAPRSLGAAPRGAGPRGDPGAGCRRADRRTARARAGVVSVLALRFRLKPPIWAGTTSPGRTRCAAAAADRRGGQADAAPHRDPKITIPEGFRASQIAERLAADGIARPRTSSATRSRASRGLALSRPDPGYGVERSPARRPRCPTAICAAERPTRIRGEPEAVPHSRLHRRARGRPPAGTPGHRGRLLEPAARRMPLQADPPCSTPWAPGRCAARPRTSRPRRRTTPTCTLGLPPGPDCSPGLGSFDGGAEARPDAARSTCGRHQGRP